MQNNETWEALTTRWIMEKKLLCCTLSAPRNKSVASKVSIRPIVLNKIYLYQISEQRGSQVLQKNLNASETVNYLQMQMAEQFKQGFLANTDGATVQLLSNRRREVVMRQKVIKNSETNSKPFSPPCLSHNRKKNYLLLEGEPIPFLIALGVMSSTGKILAAKSDKFRQINRFLEFVKDLLPALEGINPLRIVDFGCGKGYLTFALYHFLCREAGSLRSIELIGIDRKEEIISSCQKLAEQLGYHGLRFIHGDIREFSPESGTIDFAISLHACDIATDIALEHAVRWGAKVIMSAPCCQHELRQQISNELLAPILRHNVLRERFASLLTDAVRAELLEAVGYSVQVIEFIDSEHTAKNLLIRAVKTGNSSSKAHRAYEALAQAFSIRPSLEKFLNFGMV